MLKGGYKLINLKDTNLVTGGSAVKIEGLYQSIESSYRKVLLLSGVVLDSIEKNDVFVEFTSNNNDYTTEIYGKKLTITSDDDVTLATIA